MLKAITFLVGIILLSWNPPHTMADLSNINSGALFFNPATGGVNQALGDHTINVGTQGFFPTNQGGSVQGASTVAPDPNATVGNSGMTAAQIANNNSQIDQGLGQLGGQADVGNRNILNAYNSAFQTLLGGKNSALGTLNNNRTATTQDNIRAKAGIDDSVGNQSNGLRRLLGTMGAGGSSAARVLLPWLAAKEGSQQRAGVQDAFARNMNSIDQGVTDTNLQFENGVGQLNTDKEAKTNQLNSGIAQARANLLQQRANLLASQGKDFSGLQSQIGSLLSGITQLGVTPTFTPKQITPAPLDLAAYDTPAAKAATLNPGNASATEQAAGPFFSLLNGNQKKNQLGVA